MSRPNRQSGIATLIALVALAIMLIAAVALIHSSGVSQVAAGNLAFRRDLLNRAEVAINAVQASFAAGGALNATGAPDSNQKAANYSATTLASTSNNDGIPDILLASDASFAVNFQAGDIVDTANGIKIRYVVDRISSSAGPPSVSASSIGTVQFDASGSADAAKAGGGNHPVYRLSVRISGPNNTQGFLQTTFTQ